MSNSMKHVFILRTAVMALIFHSITLLIYFNHFYKPFNPIYGEVNELVKSIEHEDMIFFIIISLIFCLFASIILSFTYEGIVLHNRPVITANAKVKSKKTIARVNNGDRFTLPSVSYTYNLTFEIENGTELSFNVAPMYYAIFLEGNKGVLKYKQGVSLNSFRSFELKSMD